MTTADDLTFSSFDLAFFCYEVSEVSVTYARSSWHPVKDTMARAKTAADAGRFPNARIGSYRPFEGPLQLRWRARDGAQLETAIDLDRVFPERKVLHGEAPERLYRPMPFSGGEPTIVVELVDRTVNIYLLVYLQLIARDGGPVRERAEHRTLAFSATL